ncbi:MAG: hypothetical protein L0216_10125 [Planctomycetales bacterium]|nr:hypothetical protein [Planctomycetales bacterium]
MAAKPPTQQLEAVSGRIPPPILEGYQVVRTLGAGVVGEAFVARTGDRLEVVLKVVDAGRGRILPLAAKLAEESPHAGIARVLALGEDDRGRGCLVLERVEGRPLGARGVQGSSRVEVLGLLRGLAQALSALHAAGAAHGNLKPGNVLVRRADGALAATVLDTGVMPIPGEGWQAAGRRGLAYLAPERLDAMLTGSEPDPQPAEDVYSLVALAAEALTAKELFSGGESPEALLEAKRARHYRFVGLTSPLPPPFDLRKLDDSLRRGLAADPAERPPMGEVAVALLAR